MRMSALVAVAAATVLSAHSAGAQTADTTATAVERGVSACNAIVLARAEPAATAAIVRREGLQASPPKPPLLQKHLFPNSARVDWWGIASSPGKVLVAVDPGAATCTVFLLGAQGGPVITYMASRMKDWSRYPTDNAGQILLYRTAATGGTQVVDMHDGGAITDPTMIGALFQSKILK
jgi:hypothetical protein